MNGMIVLQGIQQGPAVATGTTVTSEKLPTVTDEEEVDINGAEWFPSPSIPAKSKTTKVKHYETS